VVRPARPTAFNRCVCSLVRSLARSFVRFFVRSSPVFLSPPRVQGVWQLPVQPERRVCRSLSRKPTYAPISRYSRESNLLSSSCTNHCRPPIVRRGSTVMKDRKRLEDRFANDWTILLSSSLEGKRSRWKSFPSDRARFSSSLCVY